MYRKKTKSITFGGPHSVRLVAPGLLGFASLVMLSLPGSAQPAPPACEQIKAACERAGFKFGSVGSGSGLWVDCIAPIVEGRPQPQNASLPLPQLNPNVGPDCKAADPDYAARHLTGAPNVGQGPPPAGGDEEFAWNGDRYGWYDDGWDGAGWYVVGFEFRRGLGFGGREGWNGWHHHGSHRHGDDHHGDHHDGDHHGDHHGGDHHGGDHHGTGHHGGGHHGGSHHGSSHHGGGHHGGGKHH